MMQSQINVRLPEPKKKAFQLACLSSGVRMQAVLTACVEMVTSPQHPAVVKALIERAKAIRSEVVGP